MAGALSPCLFNNRFDFTASDTLFRIAHLTLQVLSGFPHISNVNTTSALKRRHKIQLTHSIIIRVTIELRGDRNTFLSHVKHTRRSY